LATGSVVDPDSLNPDMDPAFQVNPDPDPPGFLCPKIEGKNTAEIFYISFLNKNCHLLGPSAQ
jgi:hypothetical protein